MSHNAYGDLIAPGDEHGPFGRAPFEAITGDEPRAVLRVGNQIVADGRLARAAVVNGVPTIVIDGVTHEFHGGAARRVGLTIAGR